MLQHSKGFIIKCLLASLLLFATCTACQNDNEVYLLKDFYEDAALQSGLLIDEENAEDALEKWGIVLKDSENDEPLTYLLMADVCGQLMGLEGDYLAQLQNLQWLGENISGDEKVLKKTGEEVLSKVVDYINNQEIVEKEEFRLKEDYLQFAESLKDGLKDDFGNYEIGELLYSESDEMFYRIVDYQNGEYLLEECTIEEVFEEIEIGASGALDFTEAEIIPSGDISETSYFVDEYQLLADGGNNVFYRDGFRVSYSLSTSRIRFYISKKNDKGLNFYGEFILSNLYPDFLFDLGDEGIEHAYFKLRFDTAESFGISSGKYRDYAVNFKDLDSSSFLAAVKSSLHSKDDEVDMRIPLCTIKLPIANIPTLYLNLDLALHFYVSGRVELAIEDDYEIGFEIKNNNLRLIFDQDHDLDAIIKASANSTVGAVFSVDLLGQTLADVGVDAGIRAYVQSILHMYDSEGNMTTTTLDETYEALDDVAGENEDVAVCGDLSLHWLLDLVINSDDSLLGRWGLSRTFNLLDDDNQIFNNMSHIENGHFVPECTRKNRLPTVSSETISSDRILLEKYAQVISSGESLAIPIKALPQGYERKDLVYESSDPKIADVQNGIINAHQAGSVEIHIATADGQYTASFNVLVSDG